MDYRISLSVPTKFSGQSLFWLLTLAVSGFALLFDGTSGHWTNWGHSLFLPLALCGLLTAGLGFWVVPGLRALKAGQIIREDGPQAHLKKAGTPTMGGIFLIPVGITIALLWSGFNLEVVAAALMTIAYSFIGWIDDWQILRQKSNKGISPKMKLGLQMSFAIAFCLGLAKLQPTLTSIDLPWGLILPLGLLFWPLAIFVLVAESNATNITDGVDGLMGGLGAIIFLGLATTIASHSPELATFCACLSGSCLGFVAHNHNPAKVFMGDTGSLGLGGALAAVALETNTLWILLILSGILFLETLSVMLQVGYYKATKGPDGVGKRLFKMAPFHHHLELSGWPETQVVGVFYLINGILALIAYWGIKTW